MPACTLLAGDLRAESGVDRQRSAWPQEQEDRSKTPLSQWLPKVLGSGEAEPQSETEPAASEPAAPAPKQQPRRRAAEPEPDPEPKLTAEEQAAENLWWQEVGDAAVSAFSRCLREHVIDEVTRGSQSSYPDFVTTAMNNRCSRQFGAMARVILDRHGEDNFARIARKLIATKFVPAVKQVVEGGPSEVIPPEDERPTLEVEMRQSKESMLDCLATEADRLAAGSAAPPEQVADRVIAACRTTAEVFFGKLERLYPAATGGKPSETAAILDASYRPAIIQRIATVRADGVPADTGGAVAGGKADAQPASPKRPETVSHKNPEVISDAPEAVSPQGLQAISPAGEPAPASPAPASSRP
jgi:hypothetical protein